MRTRLIVVLALTALGMSVCISKVFAADLTVTCNLTDCTNGQANFCTMTPSSGSALFEESNQLPGYSVTRRITMTNTGTCDCGAVVLATSNETLTPGTPSNFPTKLFTVIKYGSSDIYGVRNGTTKASNAQSLGDVFTSSGIDLGSLISGQSKAFDWVLTFDPLAGNEYQNVEAQFDFSMEFRCGTGPSDDGDDGDDDNKDNTEDETPPPPGDVGSFFTPLLNIFTPGSVAGVETSQSTPSLPISTQPGEVGGASKGVCVDPWWWWLVFVVQVLAQMATTKFISKASLNKKPRYYAVQLLLSALFVLVFYVFFCPWWDYLLAFIFGLVWVALTKRKFDSLAKENLGGTKPLVDGMYKRLS